MPRTTLAAIAPVLFLVGGVLAQQPAGDPPTPRRPGIDSGRSAGLNVGDTISPLAAFDADGKPFALSRLEGSYSVIVFGCLT